MHRRHPLLRAALMLMPLLGSTVRLHAHNAETPIAITQELNRCLTMVRIAATRRPASQGMKRGGRDSRLTGGSEAIIRIAERRIQFAALRDSRDRDGMTPRAAA